MINVIVSLKRSTGTTEHLNCCCHYIFLSLLFSGISLPKEVSEYSIANGYNARERKNSRNMVSKWNIDGECPQ